MIFNMLAPLYLCTSVCTTDVQILSRYLGVHAQEACRHDMLYVVSTCLVYVCVCYNSSINIVRFYIPSKVHMVFVLGGFSIKPSVQKLWHEKANILISIIAYHDLLWR